MTAPTRVRLLNVPAMYGVSQVRKFVATFLEIPQDAVVCRKAPRWTHALLSFRPAAGLAAVPDLELYRAKLAGAEWKKTKLDAKLEQAEHQSLLGFKRDRDRERERGDGPAPPLKTLNDQVTPLWRMPYEEQLVRKHDKLQALLRQRVAGPGEAFAMEPIKASPTIYGYRNKCEFSIAYDRDGRPAVGFLLGTYKDGIVVVENARDCVHVPAVLKQLASHLEAAVQASPLLPYDRESKAGFWRLMLGRVHDQRVMAVLQVNSQGLGREERSAALAAITEHMRQCKLTDEAGIEYPLQSFFIQDTTAVHNGVDLKTPFSLIFGSAHVVQTLCNIKFRISPLSFFQVNQTATEVLYDTIKEYALDASDHGGAVLLDLCCGTGTIGMTLAPHVQRVVGVELVQDAIEDAKVNAALNSITNIDFECSRVETAIGKIIASCPPDQPIVVILDPPRSGIHTSVIKAVRKCSRISRVVYVSCNPEAAANNFVDFTRSTTKGMTGVPFHLSRAVAVDLFPMTEHCELVLQFNRDNKASSD